MAEVRKLSAIAFADIAGYTRQMQNDENFALQMLDRFKKGIETFTEECNGEVIQFYGDGCLILFDNAVSAVQFSYTLQKHFGEGEKVPVRIGLHMGDVVRKEGNAFSDSINIASRIESMGVPGSVLFSEEVKNQLHNQKDFHFEKLGSFEFKNVEGLKAVYVLTMPGLKLPDRNKLSGKLKQTGKQNRTRYLYQAMGLLALLILSIWLVETFWPFKDSNAPKIESLAIFPFENSQDDEEIAYLSDGIPENLINRLSTIPELKVFSRNATFSIRESMNDIETIRELLGADIVFSGKIQKVSDQLVLNCQLINTKSNQNIWGQRVKEEITDIFKLEDSLVILLSSELKLKLSGAGSNEEKVAVNPRAYTEYLRGRHLSYGSTAEESDLALQHFREAILIDANFAPAYAAIANEKIIHAMFSTATRKEIFGEARTVVQSALAIDPNLAEAYTVDGAIKFYGDWDFIGAEISYKKALDLDPNDAENYIRYSAMLAALGKFKKSIDLANKAVILDPVSISSLHNLGWVNLIAGNLQDSEDAFGKALELHPNWTWGHLKKGMAHMYQGEFPEAIQLADRVSEILSDGWGSELIQSSLMSIYDFCQEYEKRELILNNFQKHFEENGYNDPFPVYQYYRKRGDLKSADQWKVRTVEERSPSAYLMNLKVFFSDEEFYSAVHQELLKKMGFIK